MRNQNEIEKPSARIKIVAHKIDLAMASTLDQISWFAGVSQMSLSEKKGHQEIVDNLQDVFASLKNARIRHRCQDNRRQRKTDKDQIFLPA